MSDLLTIYPLVFSGLDKDSRGMHISKMLVSAPNISDFDLKGCVFYKCIFTFSTQSPMTENLQCVIIDEHESLENVLIHLNLHSTSGFSIFGDTFGVAFGERADPYLEYTYPLIKEDLSISTSLNVTDNETAVKLDTCLLYGYKVKHLGISNIQELSDAFIHLEYKIDNLSYSVSFIIDYCVELVFSALNLTDYVKGDNLEVASFSHCNFDQSDWRYFSSNVTEITNIVRRVSNAIYNVQDEYHRNKKNITEIKTELIGRLKLFTFNDCSFIGAKGIDGVKSLPYFHFHNCIFDPIRKGPIEEDYTSFELRMSVFRNHVVASKNINYFRLQINESYVFNVDFNIRKSIISDISGTLFKNASFESIRWVDCSFVSCKFINCNFNNAQFKDSDFHECTFINCTFNEISVFFSQEYIDNELYSENPSLLNNPLHIDNIEISIKTLKDAYEGGFRVFKFSQPTLFQVPQERVRDTLRTLDIGNITYHESEYSRKIKESNIIGENNGLRYEIYVDLPMEWFSGSIGPLTKESTMPNFDIELLEQEQRNTQSNYIDFEDEDLITVKRNRRKYRRNDDI